MIVYLNVSLFRFFMIKIIAKGKIDLNISQYSRFYEEGYEKRSLFQKQTFRKI